MSEVKNKDVEQEQLRLEYCFDRGFNRALRIIQLTGEIEDGHFGFIDACLNELEKDNRKSVTIRINSPGGNVYEALAIVGRIKSSPCQIITEGYGHVMSAATLILAAGTKRRLSKFSWVMCHEASYGLEGRHSDIKDELKQMEREEQVWCHWMEEFTTTSAAKWSELCHKRNLYLHSKEAIELGIVDDII